MWKAWEVCPPIPERPSHEGGLDAVFCASRRQKWGQPCDLVRGSVGAVKNVDPEATLLPANPPQPLPIYRVRHEL